MKYYIKIEKKNSKDSQSTIMLSSVSKTLHSIQIYFSSPADVDSKSNNINNTITIKGKLDSKNRENAKLMSQWALIDSTSPEAYRNLTIWIIGPGPDNDNITDPIYKKIILTNAFVIDYKEVYDQDIENSEKNTYEITLKQKQDKLSEIKIEASGTRFSPKDEGFNEENNEGK